jgi:acyl-CoA thioesterase
MSPTKPDGELDVDTQVDRRDGVWAGRVVPGWNIGTNPNGGYTLVLAVRAMLAACDRPDPLTVTAHYVAPPAPGPVTVAAEVVRAGRRYATVSARMLQGERELIRLLGAFGDLDAQHGPTRIGAVIPDVAAPEDCVRMLDLGDWGGGRPLPEIMHRYDLRLDPASQWVRARSGHGESVTGAGDVSLTPLEVAGWIRFADGTPPSLLALLAMADAFPPTMVGGVDVGWVPTIELTVHLRRRPAPGWILGVFRTRFLIDGVLEQDGELWDCDANLVALCRQMGLVLPKR